jgi:hypothetical protein
MRPVDSRKGINDFHGSWNFIDVQFHSIERGLGGLNRSLFEKIEQHRLPQAKKKTCPSMRFAYSGHSTRCLSYGRKAALKMRLLANMLGPP